MTKELNQETKKMEQEKVINIYNESRGNFSRILTRKNIWTYDYRKEVWSVVPLPFFAGPTSTMRPIEKQEK